MIRSHPKRRVEIRVACDARPGDSFHSLHAYPKKDFEAAAKSIVEWDGLDGCQLRLEVRDVWEWVDVTADVDDLVSEEQAIRDTPRVAATPLAVVGQLELL